MPLHLDEGASGGMGASGGTGGRAHFGFLDGAAIEKIKSRAFELLESYGVVFIHPLAAEALKKAGARPGSGADRLRLPRQLVAEALAAAPKKVTLYGKKPSLDLHLPRGGGGFVMRTGTGAHGYVDPETGVYRNLDLKAVAEIAAVANDLGEVGMIAHTYGSGSDTPDVEVQSMAERTLIAQTVALSGADILGGVGQLECATVFSPVQAVLDNEVGAMLRQFIRVPEVSDESLNWDEISAIRTGGHFLDSPHTLAKCREQLTQQAFLRQNRDDYEAAGRRAVFDQARGMALASIRKAAPEGLVKYSTSPAFTQDSLPTALRKNHRTKSSVWAKAVVTQGSIDYILEETPEEFLTAHAGSFALIEPEVPHRVRITGKVMFHLEFYRRGE